MIARLTGKIIQTTSKFVVIDVHNVGYKVHCTTGFLNSEGVEATLYIYHYIREDQQSLYGFLTEAELQLFELLITVNGVGPKAAMAIMSSSSAEKITGAIAQGDVSLFKAVSGIGQKVAAKIIVELKNKVGGLGDIDLAGLDAGNEVVEALESLGYKKPEIAQALRDIPADITSTQSKVTWALKNLGKRN